MFCDLIFKDWRGDGGGSKGEEGGMGEIKMLRELSKRLEKIRYQ